MNFVFEGFEKNGRTNHNIGLDRLKPVWSFYCLLKTVNNSIVGMEWRETWQSVIIPNRTNHQQIKAIKTLHRSRFLFLKTPQTHQHCGANAFKTKCDGNVIIKHAQDVSADEKVRREQILSARKGSLRKRRLDSISVGPVLLAF